MLMAPASNQLQTLRLVVGVQNGSGQLTARISDASDAKAVVNLTGGSTETEYVVDIPYRANKDGRSVLVKWVVDNENSDESTSVSIKSAALLDTVGIQAETVTVDQSKDAEADVKVSYIGDEAITSVRLYIDSQLPIDSIKSKYDFEYNADKNYVVVYSAEPMDNSELFTIHYTGFDEKPWLEGGEYPIKLTVVDITGADGEQLSLTGSGLDGAIVIDNTPAPGDINVDGVIDNRDLIMIARYLVELEQFNDKQMKAADYNEDGDINNTDLVLIAKAIAAA